MSDPRPTTAADLREQARQIRETAARRVREIQEAAEREALRFEDAAVLVERMDSGLPFERQSDTLDTMGTSQIVKADVASSMAGPKFRTKHPLPLRARARGMAIQDVADELSRRLKRKIPRTTVRSWYAPKGDISARPIPEDAVKILEAPPWDIPRSAWKGRITEE